MRILHVVPSYIPAWRYGGPIHSVHGLCKTLASLGHEVDVATTNVDGDRDSDVPLRDAVDLDGVKVHYFPSGFLRRLYYSPPMYRFLESRMSGWDIVHTHSVFLWPTTAAAHLARRFGKPYVVSPRGMLVKHLISRRSRLLKRAWIRSFEHRNISHAAAVHVTSAIEGADLQALGLKPKRIFDIPNGFDPPSVDVQPGSSPRMLGLPGRYLLFLGRISWKKGLDRLIKALALIPEIHLVVAGNDEEEYWPQMIKLAESLSVSERVRYVGFVEGRTKEDLLRHAVLLALPSYSENFGNVILEAMALGVPVVVTPEVGLAHAVAETSSGVVADGEPAALAGKIAMLLADPQLCERLGGNGKLAAMDFSWARIAQRMDREYRSILETSGEDRTE